MDLSNLGSGQAVSVSSFFEQPADKYGNDESLEVQWAMKAYHHAETYFNLVSAVDPTILKLTQLDDNIYKDFREHFPDLKINVLDEDHIKSEPEKVKWREYCEEYKGKVEDYNMGSLIRVNCELDVSDTNTTLVPRIQFLAIEIARNREGLNNGLREKYGKKKT